jgi:hypothetical protein
MKIHFYKIQTKFTLQKQFLLFCGVLLTTTLLTVNTVTAQEKTTISIEQLKSSVQSCTELDNYLVEKFGKQYSLKDEKVVTELKKIVTENNRTDCKCKLATYVVTELSNNQNISSPKKNK